MTKFARSDEPKVNQVQIKSKVQTLKCFILTLDINLTFACLREAPPAKVLYGGQALRRRQGFRV
jgi:hypothetical protein